MLRIHSNFRATCGDGASIGLSWIISPNLGEGHQRWMIHPSAFFLCSRKSPTHPLLSSTLFSSDTHTIQCICFRKCAWPPPPTWGMWSAELNCVTAPSSEVINSACGRLHKTTSVVFFFFFFLPVACDGCDRGRGRHPAVWCAFANFGCNWQITIICSVDLLWRLLEGGEREQGPFWIQSVSLPLDFALHFNQDG